MFVRTGQNLRKYYWIFVMFKNHHNVNQISQNKLAQNITYVLNSIKFFQDPLVMPFRIN
jgi:hypothetical protein